MCYLSIRMITIGALTAAMLSALCGAATVLPSSQASRHPASSSAQAASFTASRVDPVHIAAGDEILTGVSDTSGYHLFAASSGGAWEWQPLATLQPGGFSDERWIGRQCLTGDGREAVVVVAPWHASDSAAGMDAGGYAYLVDAHHGTVRPLASGLSLAYFDPGCGAGGQAVLTRYTRAGESATQLLNVDTGTGRVRAAAPMAGEFTSPVPVPGGVVAVSGHSLVKIAGITRSRLAAFPGAPFDLRPTADGGVELLVRESPATAGWWRVSPAGAVQRLGFGPLAGAGLFAGHVGRVFAVGLRRAASSGAITRHAILSVPRGAEPLDAVSLDGAVVLSGAPRSGRAPARQRIPAGDTELRATGSGAVLAAMAPPPGPNVMRAVPSYVGAPHITRRPGIARTAAAVGQTPTCAVPRLDPVLQVPQPDAAQVDWAAQQAARSHLTAKRPDGKWGLAASAPSADFPLPAPFGSSEPVPREVVEAVMAQESNWWQASWHALPGIAGDPLIADYYGYNASGTIDYSQADCGYGTGQITSIMTVGATDPFTGAIVPQSLQDKVAMDYAENAAATAYYLANLWNEVTAAGLTVNNNDPEKLENWYFTIWAYNTGLHPDNGPGPWGVGWLNNPINPIYPANRAPFLMDSYGDASHPADWPYQERVFGWMGVPLGGNNPDYVPAQRYPSLPAENAFCSISVNDCDPSDPNQVYCQRSDYECWWHAPVSWVSSCASDCTPTEFQVSPTAPEPAAPADPHPPVCNSTLPTNAIIVDEQTSDSNQVGCGSVNWHDSGTFSVAYGTDGFGNPVGEVDWHQLGAGFGGHFWFTHTRQAGELTADTGTWTPSGLTSGGTYNIKVFVPDTGAAAAEATYTINPGNGKAPVQRTIDQFSASNVWVGLGDFTLYAGASVQLSSVTADADGNDDTDIAFDAMAFVPVSGTIVDHTVDVATVFKYGQNIDSGLDNYLESDLVSGKVATQWGSAETFNAAQLPVCGGGGITWNCLPPAVSSAFASWGTMIANQPVARWLGEGIQAPPNPLTAGWFDDPTHYKTQTHLDVDYLVHSDGTIDPGSIDVTGYNRTGNTELAPFILPLMNAIANDYGIAAPDLSYSAPNLNSYNDVSTSADPNVTGQAPGRNYMPWIDPPVLNSSRTCLSLAAMEGATIGYKPLLNDPGVVSRVQSWENAIYQGYQKHIIADVVWDTTNTIVKEFFEPISKNPLEQWAHFTSAPQTPFDPGGSLFTFAPAIWAEPHLKLCTGSTLVQPDGGADPSGKQTTVDNSYMPDLYLFVDGQLYNASGVKATGPINTGDFTDFSAPPWQGSGSPFGIISPWNSCYIGSNADIFISRRDGNPFNLSLVQSPGETGNSVYLCDRPQEGTHYDNGEP